MTTTIPIPADPTELEEMLGDPAQMQKITADPESFKGFLAQYAKNYYDKHEDQAVQLREQTEAILADWLRDNGQDINRLPTAARQQLNPDVDPKYRHMGLFNKNAPGAVLDDMFDRPSEFLKAVWHQSTDDAKVVELRQEMRKRVSNLSSTVPSEGGFLIPERLRSELLAESLETAIVRPRARVIPMDAPQVPIPMINDESHASSVFGGIVAYWTEAAGTPSETSPEFGRAVLSARKLVAYTETDNELLTDSGQALDALIGQLFPEALAWYEDLAFLVGNGVGQPKGVLNSSAAVSVSAEAGQAAATIVWDNIVKMYARMLPQAHGRAIWIASIDTFPQLATMALAVGTGGSAVWLNNGAAGPPMTILGRPVFFTEKCPSLGTVGDINYVDLGHYLVGDLQQMTATSSPHFKFQTDKTAFKITQRVDGRPWLEAALTPYNGGDTISPVVKLATRS